MIPDVNTLPAGEVLTLSRRYRADLQDIWDLWTTPDGLASWWGPPGFQVTVESMDLRPGGIMRYRTTAVTPEQIAFMEKHGAPVTSLAELTYTEITPLRRLAYANLVDYVPGQAHYCTAFAVDLSATEGVVEMVLRFERMHDATWTELARQCREHELDKLDALLGATGKGAVV